MNTYTLIFTDFKACEKTIDGFATLLEAASASVDSDKWPNEIANYSDMTTVIRYDGEDVSVMNYAQLLALDKQLAVRETKMKSISALSTDTEISNELGLFIIWNVTNRNNWERYFVGTQKECEAEFKECGYDNVNEEIHPNNIVNQWENEVTGIGYITFGSGKTVSYSL